MTTLSLYLHIPFCAKKCRYCDFYSVKTDEQLITRFLAALTREIDLYCDHPGVGGAQVVTVFFGGGTPSVLSTSLLAQLCDIIRSRFHLANDVEWTVECNPESFSAEKASVLLDHGVTRLTFGVQTLVDRELALLGRIHSAGRSIDVLNDPVLQRFQSIGVDIIYGLPGQTIASLEQTLTVLLSFPVITHISAYELTVAQGTPFDRHRMRLPLPDDEAMTTITRRLWERLVEAGFEHYEVSNFARPGYRCRHNEAYWDHQPYLGLGPAAHSYIHPERWGNVRDIHQYCDMIAAKSCPREFTETLDSQKLATEMFFLGLRRANGINEVHFAEKSNNKLSDLIDIQKINLFVQQGLLQYEKPVWRPTEKGMLMADGMARKLLSGA